jgi:hypothetical protein
MKRIFFLAVAGALSLTCESSSSETAVSEDSALIAPNNDEKSSTNKQLYNDLMLPKTIGIFRGTSFGMTKASVLDIETSRSKVAVFKDENIEELIVTTDMGKVVLDFADITYRFDEKGLVSMKVKSYAVNLADATAVFNMIVEKYTKAFGEPSMVEDGFYEFSATNERSGNAYSIAIKNIDDVEERFGMYIYFALL